MAINDFSSLLQLIATFSIAFVAVEYVKSFTQALCIKYFKYDEFVTKKLKACRKTIADQDTLSSLKPIVVGNNNSTSNKIEQAKRNHESIVKEINAKEAELKGKMTSACLAKSMPSICFFISLCGFMLLFTGAIESKFPDFAHCFCTVFCIVSVAYLIAGWFWGESLNPKKYRNFASFRNATFGFLILISVSGVLAIIFATATSGLCDGVWWWFLLAYVVFSFANYYIFYKKIERSINKLKQEVSSFIKGIQPKCTKSNAEIKRLITTQEVCIEVMSDVEASGSDNVKDNQAG